MRATINEVFIIGHSKRGLRGMRLLSLLILAGLSSTEQALASGFKCDERGGPLEVVLINHVQPERGTRNPAKLVIGTRRRTLLHRRGSQIRKRAINGGV